MTRPPRVLVTGGAGFLGSHLSERLLARGAEVTCLDNFHSGARENVAHLLPDPRFRLVERDVTRPLRLDVERIYNLACPASPIHYQKDPVRTVRTSVLGALRVLELARRTGARVLQASTSEVYGDPEVSPQPETYRGRVNPIGPRSCYDEGKRVAETLFFDHHRQYGVDIRVARIFNTYGPRMRDDDGRVISNFVVQALAGRPLTIHGDGSQTRSFCYVDDLIDGLLLLMEGPADLPGPVNLGSPDEISMLSLAERILALTGSRSDIVSRPRPADDPGCRCPDLRLARERLGWSPRIGLDEGLAITIDARSRARGAPL